MRVLCVVFILQLAGFCSVGIAAQPREPDIKPTVPLDKISVEQCGLQLLRPVKLRPVKIGAPGSSSCDRVNTAGWFLDEGGGGGECTGVLVGAGCNGTIDMKNGTGLVFSYYKFNITHGDTPRNLYAHVVRRNLQAFINHGGRGFFEIDDDKFLDEKLYDSQKRVFVRPDDADMLARLPDGMPKLGYQMGSETQQPIRIDYIPITGSNWTGWTIEYVFPKPRKNLKRTKPYNPDTDFKGIAEPYTPDFRCIALLLGNDKMSLTMQPYCFLRKRVANLDIELSYDIFMEMIQTIRFNEGEIIPNLKLTPTFVVPALPSVGK